MINAQSEADTFAFRVDDGTTHTDGSRYSSVAKLTISVGGGSDRPTATPVAQTVAVNNILRFAESDPAFGFADEDSSDRGNNVWWGVMISELPGTGTLYNGSTAVEATDLIEVADLDDLFYVPAACTTLPTTPCTDGFKYHVRDNGNAVSANDRPGPDQEGPWLFSTEDKTLNDAGAPKPVAVTAATMPITITAADVTLPLVSIDTAKLPAAIGEGAAGMITFLRSGGDSSQPLLAYARVTSPGLADDIDIPIAFLPTETSKAVSVAIPVNSLAADDTATVTLLPLRDVITEDPMPSIYRLGTGDAVSDTFMLTNAAKVLPQLSIVNSTWPSTLAEDANLDFQIMRPGSVTGVLYFILSIKVSEDNIQYYEGQFESTDGTTVDVSIPGTDLFDGTGYGADVGDSVTIALVASDDATAQADSSITNVVSGSYAIPAAGNLLTRTVRVPQAISITTWPTTVLEPANVVFTVTRTGSTALELIWDFNYVVTPASGTPGAAATTHRTVMSFAKGSATATGTLVGTGLTGAGFGAGATFAVTLLASDASALQGVVDGSYTVPGSGDGLTRSIVWTAAPVLPTINFKPNTFPTSLAWGQDATFTLTRTGDASAALNVGYRIDRGTDSSPVFFFRTLPAFEATKDEVEITLDWVSDNIGASAGNNLRVTLLASDDTSLSFTDPPPGEYTVGTPTR